MYELNIDAATRVLPKNDLALVRLIRRPLKEGSFYTPGTLFRGEAQAGEAEAPGFLSIGEVVATSSAFEWRLPGLVGRYVVVKPEGGRGAFDGGRRVFYRSDEVVGVVDFGEQS